MADLPMYVKLRFETLFGQYPIGNVSGLKGERAKMVVVADLIQKTHGFDVDATLNTMCEIRGLSKSVLPELHEALRTLGISPMFINDYSKVQYLYEHNPVMNDLPTLIKQVAMGAF